MRQTIISPRQRGGETAHLLVNERRRLFGVKLTSCDTERSEFPVCGATRCEEISFYSKPLGIKNLLIVFSVTGSLFVWNETVASESAGEAILSSRSPTSDKRIITQLEMTTAK